MKKIIFAAAIMALSFGSLASEGKNLSYNFFQVDYSSYTADVSGTEIDADGFGLGLSFEAGENTFIAVSRDQLSGDIFGTDFDGTDLKVGVGGAWAINPSSDFFSVVSFLKSDIEVDGFGSDDDNGYAIDLGVRGMVSDTVEMFGAMNYVDIFDGNDTGLTAGVRFITSDNFGIVLSYQTADDTDGFSVGGRFEF